MPLRSAGTAQSAVSGTIPALRRTVKRRCTASGKRVATRASSYAGLTRVSINLREEHFSKGMDCRIKSGNDE
jgi:hypothetical protein